MTIFVCTSPLGTTQHNVSEFKDYHDNVMTKHLMQFGYTDLNEAAYELRIDKYKFIFAINILEKNKYIKLHSVKQPKCLINAVDCPTNPARTPHSGNK